MRSRFDEQLDLLNKELITIGALCEKAISLVLEALDNNDKEMAEKVAVFASEIDQMERDIESLCSKMLLQQQPVARDLRQISAALKMITDMERIGDQAEDIAEIISFLDGYTEKIHNQIHEMAEETIKMVTDSVEAYVKKDATLAASVIAYDDVVDENFNKIKRELIHLIAENPNEGEYTLDLLMIAKYFERIGDHASNVAEWVVFSLAGNKKG